MSNRNGLVKKENVNDSSPEEDETENNEENTDTSDSEKSEEKKMEGLNKPQPFTLEGNAEKNWSTFKRDYTLFITASGSRSKSKTVQAAILQNRLGAEAQDLLKTLKLSDEALNDPTAIIEALNNFVKPKVNETFECFKFTSRTRQDGETIEQYLTELRKLNKNCNYNELQDGLIRDNIIRHMKDKKLQQTVLKVKDLKLEDLIDSIKAHEASEEQINTTHTYDETRTVT